ncbi:MAG TPA: hypothetical protein PLZ84_02080 [Clostridia bacterium]|nr:hypothetical protein [Clostridia bacterium]
MSIKDLLCRHYAVYPKMQVQDMVKLVYQNEFAGGHMIANVRDSLLRLQEERSSGRINMSYFADIFEDIGNNLCRLHLAVFNKYDISAETVNRFFIVTANLVTGDVASFEAKLETLKECCRNHLLPYRLSEVENYLRDYKKAGYPQVGHSQVYREAYFPAYRIVKSEYSRFFELFCRIDSLTKSKDRVCVAIDGNCCAGKSRLADLIAGVYDCNVFHMDDFFLPPGLRTPERLAEAGGNVDYIRFDREVIQGLNSGRGFEYRKFDCQRNAYEPVWVNPKKLNIIEGAYSMHPKLIRNYDLKAFLSIDEEEQVSRILNRNGEQMLKRFVCEWIPMENRYFDELKIKEKCDLVF